MPSKDFNFDRKADANGNFIYPDPGLPAEPLTAPIGGLVIKLSVETTTGCRDRAHEASVTIRKVLQTRGNLPTK